MKFSECNCTTCDTVGAVTDEESMVSCCKRVDSVRSVA